MPMQANEITQGQEKLRLRVKEQERGSSKISQDEHGNTKGGNPMIKLVIEFFNNPPIKVKNPATASFEEVDVNGLQHFENLVLTPNALPYVNDKLACFGMPPVTADELPTLDGGLLVGKVGEAIVSFGGEVTRNSAGEPITHNGKPLMRQTKSVKKWLPAIA